MDLVKNAIQHNRVTRQHIINILKAHTTEEVNTIPDGWRNNLIWHAGHCVTSQQGLVYKLSGLPINVDPSMVDQFKNGTVPQRRYEAHEVDTIIQQLEDLLNQTEADYEAGNFEEYHGYKTSTQYDLQSSTDAIVFNNVHEGIHMGYMLSLRKSL